MTETDVLAIITKGLTTVITAAAPPLLMGLAVGLLISIFQTVTSIQEQTLVFVPKILAVFFSLVIFGSFILGTLKRFFIEVYGNLSNYIY